MAKKNHNSAIGIDLGQNALKAVMLRKASNGLILTNYAIQPHSAPLETADQIGEQVATLIKKMSGSAGVYVTSANSQDSILRIIQERNMPPEKVLATISSKGKAFYNEADPTQYFMDCLNLGKAKVPGKNSYLLAGMQRTAISTIATGLQKAKVPTSVLQLSPVSIFNAFEASLTEQFATGTFLLLDIGHLSSTIIASAAGSLAFVRSVQ